MATATISTKKAAKQAIEELRTKVREHHAAATKHHNDTIAALQNIEDCIDDPTFGQDEDEGPSN